MTTCLRHNRGGGEEKRKAHRASATGTAAAKTAVVLGFPASFYPAEQKGLCHTSDISNQINVSISSGAPFDCLLNLQQPPVPVLLDPGNRGGEGGGVSPQARLEQENRLRLLGK